MATLEPTAETQLQDRVSRLQRSALIRTALLSFGTVAVAAVFLWFTLHQLDKASTELAGVRAEIETAEQARKDAETLRADAETKLNDAQTKLSDAQAKLTEAMAARTAAEAGLAQAKEQVADLEGEVGELRTQLQEALNLEKYVYELKWDDLKMIAMSAGNAYQVLERIDRHRSQIHWGMANTAEGGYNSPGFARLIWSELGRSPPFDELPRDTKPPKPGDIVIYSSGYHLFYFRDHAGKEFVVGMTPFGVVSLKYDFGVKREAVLHTGF